MPVFSVYASFTSDVPKGIVVKPETIFLLVYRYFLLYTPQTFKILSHIVYQLLFPRSV